MPRRDNEFTFTTHYPFTVIRIGKNIPKLTHKPRLPLKSFRLLRMLNRSKGSCGHHGALALNHRKIVYFLPGKTGALVETVPLKLLRSIPSKHEILPGKRGWDPNVLVDDRPKHVVPPEFRLEEIE